MPDEKIVNSKRVIMECAKLETHFNKRKLTALERIMVMEMTKATLNNQITN